MNTPNFRKKTYNCGDNKIFHQEVNCVYWEVESFTCIKTCKLSLHQNPNSAQCNSCKKRESYSKEVLNDDDKKYNFTPITIKEKTTTELMQSYLKAESSQFFYGKVDDEMYNERKNICLSCPQMVNNIDGKTDEVGWCKACGCGLGADRTKLSAKLRMPSLSCPQGKFQNALGSGFTIESAVDSLGGIYKMVKKTITKKD